MFTDTPEAYFDNLIDMYILIVSKKKNKNVFLGGNVTYIKVKKKEFFLLDSFSYNTIYIYCVFFILSMLMHNLIFILLEMHKLKIKTTLCYQDGHAYLLYFYILLVGILKSIFCYIVFIYSRW